MPQKWPKIILDPIHRIIAFQNTPEERLLLDLINTREFQRLRRIKQLGMSDFVFPGSNHSRLAHSIGVMHTARLMFERLQSLKDVKYEPQERVALLSAALLHDIGHGPFSHAFEKVTGDSHESRTQEIILDENTEVSAILRDYDPKLPDLLAPIFGEEDENEDDNDKTTALRPELAAIVSSQLDADRFDYLLRDSHASGTNYGDFDLPWLIHHLFVDEERGRLYLSRKALLTAEAYVFARHHMYSTVYFHKTTRAAEKMLQLLFKRYKHLLDEAGSRPDAHARVVPDAPPAVVSAFAGKLSLEQYLSLDDYTVTEFFKACETADDTILASLGRGLVERKLYKAIDATDTGSAQADFEIQATRAVEQAGLDPTYALSRDEAVDVPYKPYDPDDPKPAAQIYVEDLTGRPIELGKVSPAVNALKKPYSLVRYYFPAELRPKLRKIAAATIYKGAASKKPPVPVRKSSAGRSKHAR